jgi:hypothetical protein
MKAPERSAVSFAIGALLLPGGETSAQLVADHTVLTAFEEIPDAEILRAAGLRLLFRHASVGVTIDNALECLQGTKLRCTAFPPYRYDRREWSFQLRGNSGWYGKVDDFVEGAEAGIDLFDAFAFKFCYLDGLDGLMEPCGSSPDPATIERAWDYLRSHMEDLEAAHPGKTFIWWTIPLTQVGQECTEVLNGRIRDHVRKNRKVLFDIADIEAHDDEGIRSTNDRGWEVAFKPFCGEQKPDAQACHPNDEGAERIAKALWWLMARIAGWDGGVGPADFVRGDANGDGGRDLSDAVSVLSYLFLGDPVPGCLASSDANDDGSVDLSDAVAILGRLFDLGWSPPPPPIECGPDPTADGLTCASFAPCG